MSFEDLNPQEAWARRNEFVIVDVREDDEYHGPLGHIEGARSIPLPELAKRSGELPRNRMLLLVCRSGARSAKACAQLGDAGFPSIANLVGGMIAWHRESLPVAGS